MSSPVYVLAVENDWIYFMYDKHLYRARTKGLRIERFQQIGNYWHIIPLDDEAVEEFQYWMMENPLT